MRKYALLGAGLATGILLAGAAEAQQAKAVSEAEFIAKTCALCHGGPAHVPPTMPAIYGASADAIYQSLIELKTDKKPYTIMGRIAKGYSDAQLKAVAEYLSRY